MLRESSTSSSSLPSLPDSAQQHGADSKQQVSSLSNSSTEICCQSSYDSNDDDGLLVELPCPPPAALLHAAEQQQRRLKQQQHQQQQCKDDAQNPHCIVLLEGSDQDSDAHICITLAPEDNALQADKPDQGVQKLVHSQQSHGSKVYDDAWCERHNWAVRAKLYVLLMLFFIAMLANILVNVYSALAPIPYWSESQVKAPQDFFMVLLPRITMYVISTVCMLTFGIFLTWYKKEPTSLHLADYLPQHAYPSVDVMLPRYKEEWHLFEPTLMAALNMDYPADKLTVYVLDDGARVGQGLEEQVQKLMRKYPNLRYVTRPSGAHAKAGNLNNGLSQASGQLVVVLDADHAAKPEFLLRAIPHLFAKDDKGERVPDFSQSNISFVQTTQVFHNTDGWIYKLLDGAQNTFYSLMMPACSGSGSALCVGTGYVMRRDALDSIGGYACGCAVEDVLTSLELHNAGWSSKYVECEWVVGLSPATLSEFYQQRERWVAGSAQLLVYRLGKKKSLTMLQWAEYLIHNWYWLVLNLVLVLVVTRVCLWLVYSAVFGSQPLQPVQLVLEYAPIYLYLLLLPNATVFQKMAWLIACFCFFPTYVSIGWAWLTGKLNPDKNTFRVKASSESFGDPWHSLAWYNIAWMGFVTIFYIVTAVPQLHIVEHPVDWVIPTVVVLWTYAMNAPVLVDLAKRLRALVHYYMARGQ